MAGVFWQALQQCIHPCARSAQTGPQRVAILRQRADFFGQQGICTLQFLVAQQQAFDALRDLVDLGSVGHTEVIVGFTSNSKRRIWAVGARGVVHMPQFNGKQEKVCIQTCSNL